MSVRVGVIGAGLMGATHVRLLAMGIPGAEVVAVSDPRAASREPLGAEVGVARLYADGGELIADPHVDAVIVASPAETHEPFVLACLEAGKPVLCEKPLAATADAARRVLHAESALGRRLVQVGFMRRFDPQYVELKRGLDADAIGAPLLVHCVHRNPRVAAGFTSEMIISDTVVHEIDVLRWLLGQEIVRVTVHAARRSGDAPGGLRDPQLVILETDAGVLADVEAFVNARYGYDIRCEVVGEAGTLALGPGAQVLTRRDGREGAAVPAGFRERFAHGYVGELQSWVAAIAEGGATGPSAWDGYAAAVVAEACIASLGSGAAVDVDPQARPPLYAEPDALVARP